MKAYTELERRFARLHDVLGAIDLLNWDRAVMMPPGGSDARGGQLATLQVIAHEMRTDAAIGDLLAEAENEAGDMDEWQRANLREMWRHYRHATALSADIVDKMSRQCTKTESIWREAKKTSDFKAVEGDLGKLVELVREVARIKGDALGKSPYDALLDQYDPYNSSEHIDELFNDFAAFLPDFLNEVLERQRKQPKLLPLDGPFPVAQQIELNTKVAEVLGFDFSRGRLDTSTHPFSSGQPGDTRITTKYNEDDFIWALLATIHETGHGLYDANSPEDWRGQVIGDSGNMGMTIHESQSLIMEKQLARGIEFWELIAPLCREAFGGSGPAWDAENLQRHATQVKRGFIRVDADEVTYPAHVILRYRLEKDMVEGNLDVADLPAAWNEGMEQLLGVTPPDHAHGCMQDIHWYDGAFGYFPTYALGAMTAAQLMETARAEIPNMSDAVRRGEISVFVDWLEKKVHKRGGLLKPVDLVREATGKPLDSGIFKNHLRRRYLGYETGDAQARGAAE